MDLYNYYNLEFQEELEMKNLFKRLKKDIKLEKKLMILIWRMDKRKENLNLKDLPVLVHQAVAQKV